MTLPKELTTITPVSKFLTLVLLLSLPFVGFLYGLKYQQQFIDYLESRASVDQYILKNQPAATQSASTANWKTYTNNDYAFSIKYPPSALIKEYSQNSEAAAPVIAITFPNDSFTSFSLEISKTYKGRETTKEIVDSLLEVRSLDKTRHISYKRSPYTVDRIGGERIISEEIIGDLKRGDIEVYIVKGKQVYSFDLRYRAKEDKEKMSLFTDQILATFKFTK